MLRVKMKTFKAHTSTLQAAEFPTVATAQVSDEAKLHGLVTAHFPS
jgi:hypothetical protein